MRGQSRIEAHPLAVHPSTGPAEQLEGLLITAELDPDLIENPISMSLDRADLVIAEWFVWRQRVPKHHRPMTGRSFARAANSPFTTSSVRSTRAH